jgi:hypothetical protein
LVSDFVFCVSFSLPRNSGNSTPAMEAISCIGGMDLMRFETKFEVEDPFPSFPPESQTVILSIFSPWMALTGV